MLRYPLKSIGSPSQRAAALVLFAAAAVILTALAFEHVGGYTPCPLCLEERYGYYAGIPALLIALVLLSSGRTGAATAVLVLVALAFLANGALGVYHAGAEWKLWAGPETCGASQPLSTGAGGLLKDLASTRVIRCDEAPWHFLGLSFAGWNAVASILLAAGALYAAIKAWGGPARAKRRWARPFKASLRLFVWVTPAAMKKDAVRRALPAYTRCRRNTPKGEEQHGRGGGEGCA